MEQYTSTYYLATWLVTVAVILFAHHLRRRSTKLNLPPGPKPLPIIGNLDITGSLPLSTIHQLSQKYGEIMHLKYGSKNVVVVSSPDLAKVILKTMDVKFGCHPKVMAGIYTSYNYSGIILTQSGPYLSQARKVCTMELFSAKRLEWYKHIRVDEIKSLLKTVHKLSGEEIVLKDVLLTLSLNVITRMVLGKTYNLDKSKEIYKTLSELSFLNLVPNIGDLIPWTSFMDIQGYVKRMKALSKKIDRFLEHELNDHDARRKADGETFVPSDMVDVLLQAANDPTFDIKLERHGVKAITQDLLIGGTDGAVATVEKAMLQLLKKPEILKKASDELDRVIGRNRWVEEKDIPNLPYINAIIKETMRLHPALPILDRRARDDCKVAGYDIPKDTIMFVNVWSIGRDPQLWDKPEEFYPERFIGKEIDVKGNHFELLPFGAGRRMCLGCNLGLKLVESSLANLLHGFSWKLPMTKDNSQMKEKSALTTEPLVTIAHPRLHPEMYL